MSRSGKNSAARDRASRGPRLRGFGRTATATALALVVAAGVTTLQAYDRPSSAASGVPADAVRADGGNGGTKADKRRAERDKAKVDKKLDGAKQDMDESSATLERATNALRAAQVRLATARQALAAVQGRVVAAQARDRALAAQLAAAQRAVDDARVRLTGARESLEQQRGEVAAFAVESYRQARVDDLAAVLATGSPSDLVARMRYADSVAASQSVALQRLDAARAAVGGQRAAVEAAERVTAQRRAEAAANLARLRSLEEQAEAARASVARLVAERAREQAAADRAARADRARYQALVAERERISRLLRQIARKEKAEEQRRRERARQAKRRSTGGGGGGGGSGGLLSYPVNGPITSPFGRRFHPILHIWKLHDGTDFGVPCGTPVHAAASGTVVSRYYNGGYGNRLIITHGWLRGASIATSYNHLSRYVVGVGAHVRRGQLVAYSGTTGYSTGCHLHFMVYRNGTAVNPMGYL